MILDATYNKLANQRQGFRRFRYNLYKTKTGEAAKIFFPVLADRLIQEQVDPALFVKVMAKYGMYEKSKYMPHPKFLASNKGFDVFQWMMRVEREKYPRPKDWKNHLNSTSRFVSSDGIYEKVMDSVEVVRETQERFDCSIGEATLICLDRLSPWFLAVCPSFQRLGGPDLLKKKYRRKVLFCMRHLIDSRRDFKKALRAFVKI